MLHASITRVGIDNNLQWIFQDISNYILQLKLTITLLGQIKMKYFIGLVVDCESETFYLSFWLNKHEESILRLRLIQSWRDVNILSFALCLETLKYHFISACYRSLPLFVVSCQISLLQQRSVCMRAICALFPIRWHNRQLWQTHNGGPAVKDHFGRVLGHVDFGEATWLETFLASEVFSRGRPDFVVLGWVGPQLSWCLNMMIPEG